MKTFKVIACIFLMSVMLISCASGYSLPDGSLFTSVVLNKDVSSAADLNTKSGEACATSFLGAFSFGDAGAKKAATNGGIKIVKAVDFRYNSVLYGVLFASVCTVVRGE
jgi:hypothetical protein